MSATILIASEGRRTPRHNEMLTRGLAPGSAPAGAIVRGDEVGHAGGEAQIAAGFAIDPASGNLTHVASGSVSPVLPREFLASRKEFDDADVAARQRQRGNGSLTPEHRDRPVTPAK
jgi:hypothetical protein